MAGKAKPTTAGDIMLRPVVSAPCGTTVGRAGKLLEEGSYQGLVMREGHQIKGAFRAADIDPAENHDTPLENLDCRMMHRIVDNGATLEDIMGLLGENPNSVLVVVGEHGQPEGIIDAPHLMRWLSQALSLAEDRLTAVVDTVNEAVTIIDRDEKVVCWNKRAEDLYGIPADQIMGRPIKSFFTQLVVTRVLEDNREIRNSYHQPCEGTHVLINAGPIRQGEKLIGSISAERDITELVHLHQDLSRANSQVRLLEKEIKSLNGVRDPFKKIMGHSRRLVETVNMARRVSGTTASVLIRGESGTGKDLFAEAIHRDSMRRDKPFIVINCGAIPPNLFESELFGYRGGAFTGADRRGKPGKFELADSGTIFLDEIGELPLDMQVKLLRVIQQNVFYRVGGNTPVKVNVRIISATNRNLEDMIAQRQFREDLYYRLNVVTLEIPPLRERKEDIPELVYSFINEFARQHNRRISQVAPEVMSVFLNYSWPGNIRELRNVLERLVILTEEDTIRVEHLPVSIRKISMDNHVQTGTSTLSDLTRRTEREIIARALQQAGGNKALAARALGIPRSTLYYRMKTLQLD